MSLKEEFIFWKLAHFFITEQGYRIVRLFEDQTELWLEKLEDRKLPIIRILLHPFDWSNNMQKDIEYTAANGEKIRKQLRRNEISVMNLYICPYSPVDDYEFRLAEPFVFSNEGKTKVTSILLANGRYEAGFKELSKLLGKDIHFPVKEEYSETEIESNKITALDFAQKKEKEEKALFAGGTPYLTYTFLFIQIAVFFWLETHGGSTNISTLITYGAKVNALIYEGQWWRFFTPIFLHIGFLHLAMNSLALYFLGTPVERLYGNIRFLFIYLFAGVVGFIASFLFSTSISAGASGAIFGCFGALLFFGAIYPKLFYRTMGPNLIFILVINLVFDFSTTGIDNAGHIGGLISGFLAAGIVYFPKKKNWLLQFLFLAMTIVLVWGALSYGFSSSALAKDQVSSIMQAQNYINDRQYNKVITLLTDAEKKTPNPSYQLYFYLSYAELQENNLADAKANLLKALQLQPNFDEADYNLAIIYLRENDLKNAKKYAEKALQLKPDQKDYANMVNGINASSSSSRG